MSVRWVKQKNGSGIEVEFVLVDAVYRHPDGRQERVRKLAEIQNLRDAKREEVAILAALAAGTFKRKPEPARAPAPTTAPTFAEFAETFVETYARTNNKPSEVESKQSILKHHLVPAFGKLSLDAVKLEQIERFKASQLKLGLKAKTVNNQLTVLCRMLSLAVEWERIAVAPPIKWLKTPDDEFTFFSFEETARLIASAGDWRPMILTAAKTGLRIGELLALRWCDVDTRNGLICVRRAISRGKLGTPKGGRSREVALSDEAARALAGHRHLRSRNEDLVFCDTAGGFLTRGATKWPLYSACKRANVQRVGWHVLRHTFASHLAMRGVPIKAIQELLGHATIEMTMRYAHLSPDVKREAVRLLDGNGHGKPAANETSGLPWTAEKA